MCTSGRKVAVHHSGNTIRSVLSVGRVRMNHNCRESGCLLCMITSLYAEIQELKEDNKILAIELIMRPIRECVHCLKEGRNEKDDQKEIDA